jgi:hypothetical protein
MFALLNSLLHRSRPGRRVARGKNRPRLEVQRLEDRRLLSSTVTVINALDPLSLTMGTLRWAVNQANSDATAGISDTILFDPNQMGTSTITLQKGVLELKPGSGTITIDGGNQITLSGNNASSVFLVDSGAKAALEGLTVQAGKAPIAGGGIFNAGSLALNNDTLSGNVAGLGGGLGGGGIYNVGTMSISNTTLSGNSAPYGGGIRNAGNLVVSDTTLSLNSAPFGGGIYDDNSGTLMVRAATISANSATFAGGGIDNLGTLELVDTIVAGNQVSNGTGPDVSGQVNVASAYNLIGNGTGAFGILSGVNHSHVGTNMVPINPMLASLGNYGGPTRTMALLPGSPAIGAGEAFPGITTDQRGMPVANPPDVGAYQTKAVSSFVISGAPSTVTAGTPFSVTITATDASNQTVTGYTGPVTLYSSDSPLIPVASVTLVNGTITAPVTLYKADTVQLTASAGSVKGTSGNITVNPGAAKSLSFIGSTMGLGVTAGTHFTVAVTIQDAYGNTVTGYNGIAQLTCSDHQPVLGPSVKLINGTGTTSVVLDHADNVTLTATAGVLQGTSSSFHVSGGAPIYLSYAWAIPSETAGTGFTVTILGSDAFGNGANASLELYSSDNQPVSPNIISLSNGQATPTVTLDVANSVTLTASVMTNQPVWVTSNKFTVTPGPAASLIVSAPSSVTAGTPFTVTITAKDAYGNTATGYNGWASLSASDVTLNQLLPSVTLNRGIGSASVKIDKIDTFTLTATDSKKNKLKGISSSITVNAGPVAFFDVIAQLQNNTVAVGTQFTVTITAEDANYNTVTSYNGSVSLTCSDGQPTGSTVYTSGSSAGTQDTTAYAYLSGGTGTATVLLETADSVTLSASDGSLTGSSPITVTPDWLSSNVPDQRLQTLARWDYNRDGAITFADMEGLLNVAIYEAGTFPNENVVSLGNSLNNLVSGPLSMPDYVRNLASKVVNPSSNDLSNLRALGVLPPPYQGESDLQVAAANGQALVAEWFLGAVHPTMTDGTAGNYSNVSEGLFDASNPNPTVGAPVYTDVFQGGVNDCTLMASLAEVAYRNPGIIQSMFIYDGTAQERGATVNVWTVRFYHNGQADYVTVDSELPGGGTQYAHPENNLWAALAEKAYAQINIEGWLNTIDNSLNDYSMAGKFSYAALNQGDAATMDQELGAITGSSSGHFDGFGGLGQPKASDIANHLENGEFVVMGTPNSSPGAGWVLVHNHAYAVLSYDPNTDHFTLFNPWGLKNGKYNYSSPYTGAYDLFWVNSDFLNSNFSAGAQAGTAAIGPGNVKVPEQVASPTSPLPPPRAIFVSVPSPRGNVTLADVGVSLPLASVAQQGPPTPTAASLTQPANGRSLVPDSGLTASNPYPPGFVRWNLDLLTEVLMRNPGKSDADPLQGEEELSQ